MQIPQVMGCCVTSSNPAARIASASSSRSRNVATECGRYLYAPDRSRARSVAVTGMMLKFSYTAWAQFLAKLMGGTVGAGLIHRACAIITFTYFGLQLCNLKSKS